MAAGFAGAAKVMLLITFLAPQARAAFPALVLAPAFLTSPVRVAAPTVMVLELASLSVMRFWTSASDLGAAAAFAGLPSFFYSS